MDYPHATALTNERDWAAIQKAFNALHPTYGGCVVIPSGGYKINRTLIAPADVTGRTVDIIGLGEARLQNTAPANTPTLQASGGTAGAMIDGLRIRNLVFTGEAAFPNHAITCTGSSGRSSRTVRSACMGARPR